MTVLSSKQVLQEKNTTDLNAITSLILTTKALSDVSCLNEFKNLERLDLTFNNLSSLEGLKSCVKLKWLSVVQNKLQSLKGVEGLVNLTVLNAGKNKLRSMEEVASLVSLRALILNDNEIVSLCRLDRMKELKTLVLSRNPIREIGESLAKVKLITKLSLSYCQLQTIDSSIKSCTELKELRLAHNEIKTLPGELSRNVKIQILDLGNNLIIRWSDLKVLSSLVNLRNLNLLGNPIAEKDMLAKKIKKLVPSLQIFNARPMDKSVKNEKGGRVDDSSLDAGNKPVVQKGDELDNSMGNKILKRQISSQSSGGHLDDAGDIDMKKELKLKKQKKKELSRESALDQEVNNENIVIDKVETTFTEPDLQKELRRKKWKTNEHLKERASDHKGDGTITEKELNRKSNKVKQDVIDDKETAFSDLFTVDTAGNDRNSNKKRDVNVIGGLVSFPNKNKKHKSRGTGSSALQLLSPVGEVGLGGPSAWDEE